jgi:hypothetical protein
MKLRDWKERLRTPSSATPVVDRPKTPMGRFKTGVFQISYARLRNDWAIGLLAEDDRELLLECGHDPNLFTLEKDHGIMDGTYSFQCYMDDENKQSFLLRNDPERGLVSIDIAPRAESEMKKLLGQSLERGGAFSHRLFLAACKDMRALRGWPEESKFAVIKTDDRGFDAEEVPEGTYRDRLMFSAHVDSNGKLTAILPRWPGVVLKLNGETFR